ncbi:Eukaryotic translation initiation factor 4E type 2 [Tritrichomonas musculus]|uniref:Eukaryotic translation initiation factor 4E type 2 n=1 Tax=Tritrichomonas musculus TaxID=1915356 RepID=A0ABR2KFP9_9EUKA
MTHPLQTSWTLYYQQPNPDDTDNKDYASSIHKIGKFDTVEDFWQFYSHLKRPNEITESIEFHIFRNDIRGMWEDEENRNGGKWILFLRKEYSPQYWEKTVLSLIGELIHEDVLGAVIAIRADTDILSFWTREGRGPTTDSTLQNIAESISRALDLPNDTQLKFKQHFENNKNNTARDQRRLFSYKVVNNGANPNGQSKNQRMRDKRSPGKQQQKPKS